MIFQLIIGLNLIAFRKVEIRVLVKLGTGDRPPHEARLPKTFCIAESVLIGYICIVGYVVDVMASILFKVWQIISGKAFVTNFRNRLTIDGTGVEDVANLPAADLIQVV